MTDKTALITGIGGQDGSFLAEFLLKKGYTVYGLLPHRNDSTLNNLAGVKDRIECIPGDMTDEQSLRDAVALAEPDEVYNLAAQSFVGKSWKLKTLTKMVNDVGFGYLLNACRDLAPEARIYQASTSEMFGSADPPQSELTPFKPRSPYGVSKTAAHMTAVNYRESYGMFIACGILFNHESERRGEHFVTQKIAKAAVAIHRKRQQTLKLGSLDARRDWGYAPEYVEAMWLMLQQDKPDDFVIGTGKTYSVRDFLRTAFDYVNENPVKHVVTDPDLARPVDIPVLHADANKATFCWGWAPKTTFKELVAIMCDRWIYARLPPFTGK